MSLLERFRTWVKPWFCTNHVYDDGQLIDIGRGKLFTCTKCGHKEIL